MPPPGVAPRWQDPPPLPRFFPGGSPSAGPGGCWKGWFMIACLEVSWPDLSAFQEFFERDSLTAARAGSRPVRLGA